MPNHYTEKGLSGPVIQVAGVKTVDEALMLARLGATHIGFPLGEGVVEQDMDPQGVRACARALQGRCSMTLITYLDDPGEIAGLSGLAGTDTIQIHGSISPDRLAALKKIEPEKVILKSVVVGRDADPVALVRSLAPYVDGFITDTYDPETGQSGATGKTHDLAISAEVVRASGKPVILAGGLTPENVDQAIRKVRPFGVDAHTGLEDGLGFKDCNKVEVFVTRCQQAFSVLDPQ